MLKLVKYMKRSVGYMLLIVLLLFLQAYCDLSLPSYTSDIINVGIQQKGIEDGVPEQISAQSFKHLLLFLDEEQQEQVKSVYKEQGDAGICRKSAAKRDRS